MGAECVRNWERTSSRLHACHWKTQEAIMWIFHEFWQKPVENCVRNVVNQPIELVCMCNKQFRKTERQGLQFGWLWIEPSGRGREREGKKERARGIIYCLECYVCHKFKLMGNSVFDVSSNPSTETQLYETTLPRRTTSRKFKMIYAVFVFLEWSP